MVIAISALVVCVAGVLLYALATNGKLAEIGRIMFFVGLLALVLGTSGMTELRFTH